MSKGQHQSSLGSYYSLCPPESLSCHEARHGALFRYSESKQQVQELKHQKKTSLVLPVGINKVSKDTEAWREENMTEKDHL